MEASEGKEPYVKIICGSQVKGSLSDLCLSKCPGSRLLIKVPSQTTTQQWPCLGHRGRGRRNGWMRRCYQWGRPWRKQRKSSQNTKVCLPRFPITKMTSFYITPTFLLVCSRPFAFWGQVPDSSLGITLPQFVSLGHTYPCVPSFWTVMLDPGVGQEGQRDVSSGFCHS